MSIPKLATLFSGVMIVAGCTGEPRDEVVVDRASVGGVVAVADIFSCKSGEVRRTESVYAPEGFASIRDSGKRAVTDPEELARYNKLCQEKANRPSR